MMNAAALALVLMFGGQGESPGVSSGIKSVKLDGSLFIIELKPRNLSDDEAAVAKTLADLIATDLDAQMERKLVTSSEVKELVDIETQRMMVDCSDEGCLAEIAGALNAEFILFGSVTKAGTRFILTLSLADQRGAILKRESLKAENISALIDGYPAAITPVVELLEGRESTRAFEPEPKVDSEKNPILGLTVFGVSTVFAAAGGLLTWASMASVADPTHPPGDRQQMQLALWGSTVTTGLAVAGMSVGSMMVLGE